MSFYTYTYMYLPKEEFSILGHTSPLVPPTSHTHHILISLLNWRVQFNRERGTSSPRVDQGGGAKQRRPRLLQTSQGGGDVVILLERGILVLWSSETWAVGGERGEGGSRSGHTSSAIYV